MAGNRYSCCNYFWDVLYDTLGSVFCYNDYDSFDEENREEERRSHVSTAVKQLIYFTTYLVILIMSGQNKLLRFLELYILFQFDDTNSAEHDG